ETSGNVHERSFSQMEGPLARGNKFAIRMRSFSADLQLIILPTSRALTRNPYRLRRSIVFFPDYPSSLGAGTHVYAVVFLKIFSVLPPTGAWQFSISRARIRNTARAPPRRDPGPCRTRRSIRAR